MRQVPCSIARFGHLKFDSMISYLQLRFPYEQSLEKSFIIRGPIDAATEHFSHWLGQSMTKNDAFHTHTQSTSIQDIPSADLPLT